MTEFFVVSGKAAGEILSDTRPQVMDLVAAAYRLHEEGQSINPDSYFLRFPDRSSCRVIALPAYLGGHINRIGIKWIGSFPPNVEIGLPRASAVLILNDQATGCPVACLEAAGISAARTGASAALAASVLLPDRRPCRVAIVGCGVIARTLVEYLVAAGVAMSDVLCLDLDRARAEGLAQHVAGVASVPASVGDDLAAALRSDLIVLATTVAAPHIGPDTRLRPGQLVLNISLRDLAPEILLSANNFVDDVEHCLKADTSPHLAERLSGSREFINGTLGAALAGGVRRDEDRATVFSPFGLGILDIAVGEHVLVEACRRGTAVAIPGWSS